MSAYSKRYNHLLIRQERNKQIYLSRIDERNVGFCTPKKGLCVRWKVTAALEFTGAQVVHHVAELVACLNDRLDT